MKQKHNEEVEKFLETAQLVFMVNFDENTQNISVGEGVNVYDLLNTPFRLAVHLNNLLEAHANEGQTGKAVEEAPKTDS